MNKVQRIAKNTAFLFISQIFSYLLAFFFVIYTARYLGSTGFGVLSFAISFAGIFSIITDLGLNMLMVREVSRDHSLEKKYLPNLLLIKIILATLTFTLIILILNLSNYPYTTMMVVYIIAISTFIAVFNEIFYFFFQSHEKMEFQSVGNILLNVLLLLGAIIAIYKGLNIIYFAFVYLISNIIILGYVLIIYFKKFRINEPKIDINFWKPTIKSALPISLFIISTTIIFRADSIILSFMQGNTILGLYTAAYRLMEAVMVIPIVFMASTYPVISKLFISSKESLSKSYEISLKYLLILGLPIAFGTTILSKEIITTFYGSEFNTSIIILQILIWTIPVFYVTYLIKTMLISINKQYLASKIIFICMIFNLLFNVILIPYYSYLAASVVNVITEIIFLIFGFYYMEKFVSKIKIMSIFLKILFACILMSVFLEFIELNIIFKIIISTVLYFTILTLLKIFSEEDIYLLKKMINKKI